MKHPSAQPHLMQAIASARNADCGGETMAALVNHLNITLASKTIDKRPDGLMDSEGRYEQVHYLLTFRIPKGSESLGGVQAGHREMETYYSMGLGSTVDPYTKGAIRRGDDYYKPRPVVAADVLLCLQTDSQAGEQLFEEWCGEYGLDTDSRKAERTYNACRDTAVKCKRFFGRYFTAFMAAVEE